MHVNMLLAVQVLDMDPYNVKALYRRAQAYMATADLLEAERDVKIGLDADPKNTDLQNLYKRLK